MERRTRRGLLWAAGLAAALVAAAAVVLVSFAVQFTGGWDEVLDFSTPQPEDPEVVAARRSAAATADAEIVRVSRQLALPAISGARVAQPAVTGTPIGSPTAPADPGDPATGSYCATGQHNWKRDDPFDLVCREVRREVLAGPSGSLVPDLHALHDALVAAGYVPASGGLPVALDRVVDPALGGGDASGQDASGQVPDRTDPTSAPAVPYLYGLYEAGDVAVHISSGLYEVAADEQPHLLAGEYGLLLELAVTSTWD